MSRRRGDRLVQCARDLRGLLGADEHFGIAIGQNRHGQTYRAATRRTDETEQFTDEQILAIVKEGESRPEGDICKLR